MKSFNRSMLWAGAVIGSIVVVVAGCSSKAVTAKSGESPSSVAQSTSAASPHPGKGCSPVTVTPDHWLTVKLPGAEPRPALRVPVMPGWMKGAAKSDTGTQAIYVNDALSVPGAHTSIVVSVSDPQGDFDAYVQGIKGAGVSAFAVTPAEVCGFQARHISYTQALSTTSAPLLVTALMVLVPNPTGAVVAGVFSQTADPNNKTYQADSDSVFNNIQVV